jgi:hypothetical protein
MIDVFQSTRPRQTNDAGAFGRGRRALQGPPEVIVAGHSPEAKQTPGYRSALSELNRKLILQAFQFRNLNLKTALRAPGERSADCNLRAADQPARAQLLAMLRSHLE